MNKDTLLKLRNRLNRSRPRFLRTHCGRLPRLSEKKWRRPTGIHNKLRYGIFGRPLSVNVGYRGPAAVRGLDSNGLLPVRINKPGDVEFLNPAVHSAIIAKVGAKNRIAILNALKAKGVSVVNCKNIETAVNKIQDEFSQRTAAAKKLSQARAAAAKEREVVKPKSEKKEASKQEAKQELDKLLVKKE